LIDAELPWKWSTVERWLIGDVVSKRHRYIMLLPVPNVNSGLVSSTVGRFGAHVYVSTKIISHDLNGTYCPLVLPGRTVTYHTPPASLPQARIVDRQFPLLPPPSSHHRRWRRSGSGLCGTRALVCCPSFPSQESCVVFAMRRNHGNTSVNNIIVTEHYRCSTLSLY
jgi:hypothetical protein